jgi:hypothetical protein
VVSFCEHGNEPSSSINDLEFIDLDLSRTLIAEIILSCIMVTIPVLYVILIYNTR